MLRLNDSFKFFVLLHFNM